MNIRPLGNRLVIKDYIPTESVKGIVLPEKIRSRYLYSNARWGVVQAVGKKCPSGVNIGDVVLAHYDQAIAFDKDGVWCVPFHAVLAKTEKE